MAVMMRKLQKALLPNISNAGTVSPDQRASYIPRPMVVSYHSIKFIV
jgi:hypothetical protein